MATGYFDAQIGVPPSSLVIEVACGSIQGSLPEFAVGVVANHGVLVDGHVGIVCGWVDGDGWTDGGRCARLSGLGSPLDQRLGLLLVVP